MLGRMDAADGTEVEGGRANPVGVHLRRAHATLRGEHQIAEYVRDLELGECARILGAEPGALAHLAASSAACRVGPGETRSFEAVIRTWTHHVLSAAEGG